MEEANFYMRRNLFSFIFYYIYLANIIRVLKASNKIYNVRLYRLQLKQQLKHCLELRHWYQILLGNFDTPILISNSHLQLLSANITTLTIFKIWRCYNVIIQTIRENNPRETKLMISENKKKRGEEIKKLVIKNFILQNIGNRAGTRKFLS